ncbi:MAG: MarR family transcriptional regulator [Methanosphaera sp.]|nr:MarR family transcriptional regulator [Methanosphaera sp.]
MVKFNIDDELKYFTPLTVYMEYILLNYNNFLKNHLKDSDISTRDFLYLINIFFNKGISQKDLADLMYVSEANITKIVKKLEKKGYVVKNKDEKNKSRNLLFLSKKGELIVYQMVKLSIEWETKLTEAYDVDKRDDIKDLFYELSENSVDIN